MPLSDRDQSFIDQCAAIARGGTTIPRIRQKEEEKEVVHPTKNVPGELGIVEPGVLGIVTVPVGLPA